MPSNKSSTPSSRTKSESSSSSSSKGTYTVASASQLLGSYPPKPLPKPEDVFFATNNSSSSSTMQRTASVRRQHSTKGKEHGASDQRKTILEIKDHIKIRLEPPTTAALPAMHAHRIAAAQNTMSVQTSSDTEGNSTSGSKIAQLARSSLMQDCVAGQIYGDLSGLQTSHDPNERPCSAALPSEDTDSIASTAAAAAAASPSQRPTTRVPTASASPGSLPPSTHHSPAPRAASTAEPKSSP
ncbi:hypothetical protein M8818_005139 [Zalaria obscura]|uniref:Uncharacterized protein n=1 Tax=Zalaria obscura TaxID=2024903 RepID=A0ACC3S9U6_9PEZI